MTFNKVVKNNSANSTLQQFLWPTPREIIYIYIKYTACCILTQQDVTNVIESAKTIASMWVCVYRNNMSVKLVANMSAIFI